ncbi:protein translocase subunit SecD [Megalodesulfovibrio gigas]|uniref:Protein translocase subunit SecD n=1 Tax=Megalodesulfovibrio gigas (strain ATCC 19364 / DSM 1382 / NCIMB 9332 / VKM B-1759) TaxID=1121448 RepID=T2GDT9_MEGG1|nr:protein translocase subunit SecD [Megalodesulfovibrio gigas]AGW14468.1 putative preprotein translocase subunit SecD [Megalodesulfovibrio gigas DSM 1382 = ATCC 19364]
MMQSLRWRVGLALFVAVLGAIYLLPTLSGVRNSPLSAVLPDSTINLGLDLQGGMHLTLGVDMDKALENNLSRRGRDLRDEAREKGLVILRPTVTKANTLEFVLTKAEQQGELETLIKENYTSLAIQQSVALPDGRVRYVLGMTPAARGYYEAMTLDQAVKTIRNRIDQFGVAEPDIRPQRDDHRIIIQLPGLKERERAIEILGKTAHLEFKLVRDDADPEKARLGMVPGAEFAILKDKLPNGVEREIPIVLEKDVVMTGEYVEEATTGFDNMNRPVVLMRFDPTGARLFDKVTGENVNRRLAIVLDGVVYSAPNINERISGGRASISGSFSVEEARDLAIVLRAGALPAPVHILEERSVGPSLGQESIDKGVTAAMLGGAAVCVFMAIYYGMAGMVANMCLFFNIYLILGGMAAFGATLTLPGIAGIILTLGMAVDANVLIFERIREELRRGLTPRAALNEGFSRATLTIVDANLTTVIAAVILYQFGTGPIRGFAVTLTLGILASMFTAVFVSRIMMDFWVSKRPDACKSI